MAGMEFSSDAVVTLLPLSDIGGTNASTGWLSMAQFANIFALVELGAWNAADDLDECRLEQGIGSGGSSPKDLTTDASGGNYDTDNPIDAQGDFVVLEARAEDLDTTNGYDHVRLYVAEGGNTGVDNVSGLLIRYGARYKHGQQQGAAMTGSKVYVTPDS